MHLKDPRPPHLYRRMEETKRILRCRVEFAHERRPFIELYLFDRASLLNTKEDELIYRRCSIRYGSGSAVIHPGYGTELMCSGTSRTVVAQPK
jgi:hypothetical protein